EEGRPNGGDLHRSRPLRVGAGLRQLVGGPGRGDVRGRGRSRCAQGPRKGEAKAAALPVSSLLVRGQNGAVSANPESAGWRYVSFNALRIPAGGQFILETEGSEACIVVLSGRCAVRVGEVGW